MFTFILVLAALAVGAAVEHYLADTFEHGRATFRASLVDVLKHTLPDLWYVLVTLRWGR